MEEFRQPIILGAVALHMVFCIVVGIWAMRRTKSASDFFVASRSLGPIVVGLAVFSTSLSDFGFVGQICGLGTDGRCSGLGGKAIKTRRTG